MFYDTHGRGPIRVPGFFDPDEVRDISLIFTPRIWAANTVYSWRSCEDYDVVIPTVFKGLAYKVTNPGKTGATEPTWPTVIGETVTSGPTFEAIPYSMLPAGITITASTWRSGVVSSSTPPHSVTFRDTGSYAVTFQDVGDTVTLSTHGLAEGRPVIFSAITTTTGITTSTQYWVLAATTNTFQVSATPGGDALALTLDGSGTIITGDTVTWVNHGLANDSPVFFSVITTTTGLVTYTPYWVIMATADTFKVATTQGGGASTLTLDGSGTIVTGISGLVTLTNLMYNDTSTQATINGCDPALSSFQVTNHITKSDGQQDDIELLYIAQP